MDIDQQQLRAALLDAFPHLDDLSILVSDALGEPLQNITLANNMKKVAFDLIQWAGRHGRLTELVVAASAENPGNKELREVAQQLRFVQRDEGEPERIVVEGVPFDNAAQWLDSLARLRRAVCRFEPQPEPARDGFGSGFLVAPDVIMTAFHVAGGLSDAAAAVAQARFDYEVDLGGNLQQGRAVGLAKSWRLAGDKSLDYVLVRLAQRVTDLPPPGGAPREYIRPVAHDFRRNEPVVILQHPDAAPLKLAFGTVIDGAHGDGVTYSANTEPGSSGSPAMTSALKTAAVHHRGLTKMNRAVRMAPILEHLSATNKRDLLGP